MLIQDIEKDIKSKYNGLLDKATIVFNIFQTWLKDYKEVQKKFQDAERFKQPLDDLAREINGFNMYCSDDIVCDFNYKSICGTLKTDYSMATNFEGYIDGVMSLSLSTTFGIDREIMLYYTIYDIKELEDYVANYLETIKKER